MPHEKTYVVCENMCMEESLTKEQIEDCIEKNSGVPAGGIIDFDGNTIPEGFEEIVNYSETINVTEAGTDCNDYVDTAKYWFKNTNTPLNKPNDGGSGAGYLEVIKSDINNYVLQKWTRYDNGDCYIRVKVSGSWNAWKKVLNEDDKTSVVRIWNGTCNVNDTITLNESIKNFNFVYVRAMSDISFMVCPIHPSFNAVRGQGSYTRVSDIQLLSMRATCADTSFKLDALASLRISPSGITDASSSYTYITEIWGVR